MTQAPAGDDRSARRTGAVIREERDKRGLSLAKLAAAAGVSTACVSRLERGQRTSTLDLADAVLAAMGLRLHVEAEPQFADIDAVIRQASGRPPSEIVSEWRPSAGAFFTYFADVPFIVEGLAAASLQGAPVTVETLEIAVPADNNDALDALTVALGAMGARRGNFEIRDPRVNGSPDYLSLHGALRIRLASPFEQVLWMDIDPLPKPLFGVTWFLREHREPLPRARIALTPLAEIEASSGHVQRVIRRTRDLLASARAAQAAGPAPR
jgi:transcriptional regulator with XRE-family HTH domain